MKVAIVAGEKSGDFLGAELIKEILRRHPNAEIVGLAGPLMQQQGARSLAEMEKISIFGLDGLFSALSEILSIRKKLFEYFVEWQPDIFVGIDVPDFNLGLEKKLRKQGIPVVHYVSPTVWAWRGGRIKKIRRAVDLMLTLFPFERDFYQQRQVPVAYVGHPLAKQISNWVVADDFRDEIQLEQQRLIAILPGSRMSEVKRLLPVMLEGARLLSKHNPQLQFVIPAANQKLMDYMQQLLGDDDANIKLILGHSWDVLSLCELAILASGTAALEAALFGKPMVVMYIISLLSALVYKHTITVEHYSMPNHLTTPPAVPELIQEEATAENLFQEVSKLLEDKEHYQTMRVALESISPSLSLESSELACDAIDRLLSHSAT